jgi:hypothetical protein
LGFREIGLGRLVAPVGDRQGGHGAGDQDEDGGKASASALMNM